jgi:hypothetical protein
LRELPNPGRAVLLQCFEEHLIGRAEIDEHGLQEVGTDVRVFLRPCSFEQSTGFRSILFASRLEKGSTPA